MARLTVVCRKVSKAMASQTCELTCIEREPISFERVEAQHEAYVQVFRDMIARGYNIQLIELPALNDLPDSMFVEDVATLYNSCAVLTRPGAPSRRPEVDPIVDTVKQLRHDNYRIVEPGTVDGGDVLYVANSKYVFVGKSTRSNDAAFEQMKEYLGQRGLECVQCTVRGCLHLKSAVSFASEDTVLLNSAWIEPDIFISRGFKVIEIDPGEQESANILSFSAEKDGKALRTIITSATFPRTAARIEAFAESETTEGRATQQIVLEMDEVAKAEGALTCCSLLSYSA